MQGMQITRAKAFKRQPGWKSAETYHLGANVFDPVAQIELACKRTQMFFAPTGLETASARKLNFRIDAETALKKSGVRYYQRLKKLLAFTTNDQALHAGALICPWLKNTSRVTCSA